jgi:hypothetical protein
MRLTMPLGPAYNGGTMRCRNLLIGLLLSLGLIEALAGSVVVQA